jgi:hypothetical protein
MLISFPKEFTGKSITGSILLYCPSDNNKDIEQAFSASTNAYTMQLPVNRKGLIRSANQLAGGWHQLLF